MTPSYRGRVADVVCLYRAGFGRRPEPDAVEAFLELVEQGRSFRDLVLVVAGSDEFRTRHGPGERCDRRFVRALFRDGLDRSPTPDEEDALLRCSSRADALERVAGAPEARTRFPLLPTLFPHGAPLDSRLAYRLWLPGPDAPPPASAGARHAVTLLLAANPDRPDLLEETAASLERQQHPAWTLLVAHAADTPAAVRRTIDALLRRLPNASALPLPAGTPRHAHWRHLLAASHAPFCGFLHAGDQLAPDASRCFAAELDAHPDAALVFCDEDQIDGDGARSNPRFKPNWHRDALLAGDVVGQLALFDRDRALRCDARHHDDDELNRFALLLQLVEDLPAHRIRHIPRILFHRGRARGRAAPFPGTRAVPAHPALLRAVRDHLAAHRPDTTIDPPAPGAPDWPRIRYPLPDRPPPVSIVIPNRDNGGLLQRCVRGILHHTAYDGDVEVLVADNDSVEPATTAILRDLCRDERVTALAHPGPFNWSAINNRAAARARGELLLFLNNDVAVLHPDWLSELVRQALQPAVAVVGARLLYPDGTLQHGGIAITDTGGRHILRAAADAEPGYLGQVALARELGAVTGACMLVRRNAFATLGGFDEAFPLTCNDVEFCVRARAHGFRVVWTPHATLTHIDAATRGADRTAGQLIRTCLDNGRLLDRLPRDLPLDPFLNPNLAVTDHALLLAIPPARPDAAPP